MPCQLCVLSLAKQRSLHDMKRSSFCIIIPITNDLSYTGMCGWWSCCASTCAWDMLTRVSPLKIISMYAIISTVLPNISTALVIFYGGKLVFEGELTGGSLVSFMLYQQVCFAPAVCMTFVAREVTGLLALMPYEGSLIGWAYPDDCPFTTVAFVSVLFHSRYLFRDC